MKRIKICEKDAVVCPYSNPNFTLVSLKLKTFLCVSFHFRSRLKAAKMMFIFFIYFSLLRFFVGKLLLVPPFCSSTNIGRIFVIAPPLPSEIMFFLGGSSGLVVMRGDSCSKGHEFEPWYHILDGHFFTFICCKILMCVWKDQI